MLAREPSREHRHDKIHDFGIAGLNIILPLLIDSEWRVDDHGRFRQELESEVQLTKRIGLALEYRQRIRGGIQFF